MNAIRREFRYVRCYCCLTWPPLPVGLSPASPCLAVLPRRFASPFCLAVLPRLASPCLALPSYCLHQKICADRTDFIIILNANNYYLTNAYIKLNRSECKERKQVCKYIFQFVESRETAVLVQFEKYFTTYSDLKINLMALSVT
jgi:hypothetical protein